MFVWNGRQVRPHDRVTIITTHGSKITGSVVFSFESHVVLNTGGRYGTPKIGDHKNIIAVRKSRN